MQIIAHRCNLNGIDSSRQNINYIKEVVNKGYKCEVDIWCIGHEFWLGHDEPQCELKPGDLNQYRTNLLIHCKNYAAVSYFNSCEQNATYESFAHENDKYAFTSYGRLIVFPGQQIMDNCIVMLPEIGCDIETLKQYKYITLCTDYPKIYDKIISLRP